ncbi:MAG TPA: hypothetical protein VFO07_19115 [Roseiflexaceae bacterium]|nr:hypothetical protein [Roseiflexaceae bacterium]
MSDLSAQPGYADISYLQTVGQILEQWKRRSYELMGAETGRVLLDLGCGPGIDTRALAAIVGSSGRRMCASAV